MRSLLGSISKIWCCWILSDLILTIGVHSFCPVFLFHPLDDCLTQEIICISIDGSTRLVEKNQILIIWKPVSVKRRVDRHRTCTLLTTTAVNHYDVFEECRSELSAHV